MMIITLTTGNSYDLSIPARAQNLREYLAKLKRQEKFDEINTILEQVRPYAQYAGHDVAMKNAKRIFDGLKSLGLVPHPATVVHIPPPASIHLPTTFPNLPIQGPVPLAITLPLGSAASVPAPSTIPPLYLPQIETGAIYCITIAPINSSGDIYHMLAYLMLALKANPLVRLKFQLNFDINVSVENKQPVNSGLSVGDQVKRSLDFAESLGLEEYFEPQKLDYHKVGRTNVREDVLGKHFKARADLGERIFVVDQMATTMMIATHIQDFGYSATTKTIREGFSNRNPAVISQHILDRIEEVVNEEMTALSNLRGQQEDKPLIILHIRFSSTANKEQNLPDSFVPSFIKFVTERAYQVYLITADDRATGGYKNERGYRFNPFKIKLFENNRDHTKLLHLSLLTRLQQLPNTKGVIGNTSGTLDVAALMGLNTYNLHQFTKDTISYQECRLFFQLTFFAVGTINKEFPEILSLALQQWILQPMPKKNHDAFKRPGLKNLRESIMEHKDDATGAIKLFAATFFAPQKLPQSIKLPTAECTLSRLFEDQLKLEGPR